MAKNIFIHALIFGTLALIAGCCGSTSSSSCSLGTYGEACTQFCDRSAGTQFDSGPNCFSECTNLVRQQGLGDATTCCTETINQGCQRTCSGRLSQVVSQYGSVMDHAEKDDFTQECIGECTGAYQQMGISLDSCNMIDASMMIN